MSNFIKILNDFKTRCSVYGCRMSTILFLLKFFEKSFKVGIDLRQRIILDFLKKNFADIISQYHDAKCNKESIPPDAPIWFCWYQGENGMPELVKACLRSIRKCAGSHPLVVLDYKNIDSYVHFPRQINDKLKNHNFNLIYLSDFLRNYLLAEYGGIWLDTTIYALNPINLNNMSFWTVKRKCSDDKYVSKERWTGFAMAGIKGNPLNSFVRDVLAEYHKRYSILIDHFLIDYTIALGYEEVPCIREMIDKVPMNNEELYYIQDHIYEDYDIEIMNDIKRSHFIQKVHHRYKGCSNKKSYFYHIVNNEI